MIQWLMIRCRTNWDTRSPGKLLGYTQIRIIGWRREAFHVVRFCGLLLDHKSNSFGGLTYSASPEKLHRWKHLLFVGGGLLVNVIIGVSRGVSLALVNCSANQETWQNLYSGRTSLSSHKNLIPWVVRTSIGPIPNDGFANLADPVSLEQTPEKAFDDDSLLGGLYLPPG